MIVKMAQRGQSFKALGKYLTEAKEGHHRALWHSVENIPTDDPRLAARIMAATDAQSGSRSKKGNVFHFILSWNPDDHPEAEHQQEAAREMLRQIGLADAQALFVGHNDNGLTHLHIMVNGIDPDRGRLWADPANPDKAARNFTSNLKRKMQDWAQSYQIERYGQTITKGRDVELSRAEFERMERAAPADWMQDRAKAALYTATFRAELAKAKAEQEFTRKAEWRALFKKQEGAEVQLRQQIERARIKAEAARGEAQRAASALRKAELRANTTLGRIAQGLGLAAGVKRASEAQAAAAGRMALVADKLAALELQKARAAMAQQRERSELGERQNKRAEDTARERAKNAAASGQIVLRALTDQKSTFTSAELSRFCAAAKIEREQIERSPDFVRLGDDRFTSRELFELERTMLDTAERMASGEAHRLSMTAEGKGLAPEQIEALAQITGKSALSSVIGYAGAGKSTLLRHGVEAWEREGYKVRGAALSAIAAAELGEGAGVKSQTLHSLLHELEKVNTLDTRSVLIVDEAGLIGSRQMAQLLARADEAGAKVVLTGDPQQLQAIDAGGAFRAIAERTGASVLQTVRRQREAWQAEATKELASGDVGLALARYDAAGTIREHESREAAAAACVAAWADTAKAEPTASQIMLAPTRKEVAALNTEARRLARERGELGEDKAILTASGQANFAAGDRLLCTKNNKALGVNNGTLGTIERIEGEGREARLAVRLDGQSEAIEFTAAEYGHFTHGYALTIHKAQGVTVDRAHIMAGRFMDNHSAYVAMSRHRDEMTLHYGREDFRDQKALERALSRQNLKGTSQDYQQEAKPMPTPAEKMQQAAGRSEAAFNAAKEPEQPKVEQIERGAVAAAPAPHPRGLGGNTVAAPTRQPSEAEKAEQRAEAIERQQAANESYSRAERENQLQAKAADPMKQPEKGQASRHAGKAFADPRSEADKAGTGRTGFGSSALNQDKGDRRTQLEARQKAAQEAAKQRRDRPRDIENER